MVLIQKFILLLVLLNICHWAADFTHLSRPYMLAAKKFGRPLFPIFEHAAIHAVLMALVCFYFGATFMVVFALQLYSHFFIDVLKGRINKEYPRLQDPANYYHWWLFGIDQFLHQCVIIGIAYYALFNI